MHSFLLIIVLAAGLPGFDEFRRADRDRRQSGNWQTEESAQLTRVDQAAVLALATNRLHDAVIQWGVAELLNDWTNRQARYEAALLASGTNAAIELRYACAAAQQGERKLALALARDCQTAEPSNAVPWLLESWLRKETVRPPARAVVYADAAGNAAQARIQVLEALGYSKYAARRIGYQPTLFVPPMIRELAARPAGMETWLRQVAQAMQRSPTFLVTELVGQSVEGMLGVEAERAAELKVRREELTDLARSVGATIVDQATEGELVRYFDDMLSRGEEEALRRLKQTVVPAPRH